MVKRVQIRLDETEHEELKDIKNKHGMTWKGILISGADKVTNGEYK